MRFKAMFKSLLDVKMKAFMPLLLNLRYDEIRMVSFFLFHVVSIIS